MIKAKSAAPMAALALTALILAGCTTGETETPTETNGTISPEAQAALDRAFEGVGSSLEDVPAIEEVAEDINFYVISCGQVVAACSDAAANMVEAAEAVGWTANIADGQLNPAGFATAIRQAIAGGADVIVPIGIGCGVAQAAFAEAVEAGITIVGGGGVDDCDPKLWASQRLWLEGWTGIEQFNAYGQLAYDYAYGTLDGDVRPIVLNFTTQVWGPWISDGVVAEIDELGGDDVVATIDVADTEVADGSFVQKVTTALLANPDANTLIVPLDAWISAGLGQAIVSAGLDEQLLVISTGGSTPVLDMIRGGTGGVDATVGAAQTGWAAWGSIDTALRVLSDQDPIYIGDPLQVVDADHNMPATGYFDGTIDYKAKFREAWGL